MALPPQSGPEAPPASLLMLTLGSFSGTNRSLASALQRPGLRVVELDLKEELGRNKLAALGCGVRAIAEGGLGSLRSRASLRYQFFRSKAFSRFAERRIAAAVRGRDFFATLQTQSLFNAATPGRPNFVFTDHVALASARETDGKTLVPTTGWLDLEKQVYAEAAHIFTFGPSVRERLMETYSIPPERVSVVGAGPNVAPSGPVETSRDRYARQSILFVGMDWARKGGPELLEAFAEVRRTFPQATLTVAGCRPPVSAPGVRFLGRVALADMEALFRDASLMCMPSRIEPFGIAIVEAMHFGLPVVSTATGDIASMVTDGENGRVVPPGDVPALAAALVDLLSDADRMQDYGQRSRARAASYSWDEVARRILGSIEEAR